MTEFNLLAGKPKNPEVEFGTGGVKVKADINLLEWGRRFAEGTLEKSESFHNLSSDVKQEVKNLSSTLKEQIGVDNKNGAVQSLNKLASLYKQQAYGMPTQSLTQESLYIANKYSLLAAKVKSGDFLLKQLQVDKLGSINQNTLGDVASATKREYAEIIDAYTDKNGKIDSAKLMRDLKDNNADQETISGVIALVTPEMQRGSTREAQSQM